MAKNMKDVSLQTYRQVWAVMERLIDPDPMVRETALEDLPSLTEWQDQPLVIYLLANRLMDPNLEVRFHAVQLLGDVLNPESSSDELPAESLKSLTTYTTQIDKGQLIKLLEVSVAYLAAEEAIVRILQLCSYAGKVLGGIVNDRKLPLELRQQAIFMCGEVGFLSTAEAIRNLIQRVDKTRTRTGLIAARKKYLDEEALLPFAEAALAKLEG
jgi:HEAT repeat protein